MLYITICTVGCVPDLVSFINESLILSLFKSYWYSDLSPLTSLHSVYFIGFHTDGES